MDATNNNLLRVENLKTYFPIRKGLFRRHVGDVKAVNGVSFNVEKSQSHGLVGESGCGKTTTARTIVRLVPATEGNIVFDNINVLSANREESYQLHKDISIVFQNPYASLNPRMTIGDIVGEPLKIHTKLKRREVTKEVAGLLVKVGLSADYINRYPHEFSGGQRQRIGIARALALKPKLVICDEPVSALDVSIQSQILNLLKDLQDEFGLTFLFIAHDLAVVEFFCDTISVMYKGLIVEQAESRELYRNPLHPYTHTLLSAIPKLRHMSQEIKINDSNKHKVKSKQPIAEITTDDKNNLSRCAFYPRCLVRGNDCGKDIPPLIPVTKDKKHLVACWKYKNIQDT